MYFIKMIILKSMPWLKGLIKIVMYFLNKKKKHHTLLLKLENCKNKYALIPCLIYSKISVFAKQND